jgi:hypothetical protein
MIPAILPVALAIYLAGWLLTIWRLGRAVETVPVPGRFRRDVRDAMLWPCWLLLHAMFGLLSLRRQAYAAELLQEPGGR